MVTSHQLCIEGVSKVSRRRCAKRLYCLCTHQGRTLHCIVYVSGSTACIQNHSQLVEEWRLSIYAILHTALLSRRDNACIENTDTRTFQCKQLRYIVIYPDRRSARSTRGRAIRHSPARRLSALEKSGRHPLCPPARRGYPQKCIAKRANQNP